MSATSDPHRNTQAPTNPSPERPDCATRADENEETITSIQATDVALGLRRVPAGFYAVVYHSGLEWKTENKHSSVNYDVIEWDVPIPIPSDLSATVCIEVCASFEFQPMLGTGEQLRKVAITVEELLDHSAKHLPFAFSPENGDVLSPCSSILVTVKQQERENSDSSVSNAHRSTTESRGELEDATNRGHMVLSHYRKNGEKRDLEHSIEQFEQALSVCPVDHPCRAAAQSNLAMAKFIHCQVEDTDAALETPLSLCRAALASRPVGHFDRPSTLIHLAMVHLARFEKRRDEKEGAQAEALLHEAIELCATESHGYRAAVFMLKLHAGCSVGLVQAAGQISVDNSAARLQDEDQGILSVKLIERFQQFGDIADLQEAITLLEELVRSTSVRDRRYLTGLVNLGLALGYRFERLGELGDLEEAISKERDAVDLTPVGDLDKPDLLNNLGLSLFTRFKRLGELSDLEDGITMLRDAVDLIHHGHVHESGYLNNLGNALTARFDRLGELSDLEDAISMLRDAVGLTPHGHSGKSDYLNSLGNALTARFEGLGELSDLEDAITRYRDAVDLTPHDHSHILGYLNNLGSAFLVRFNLLGELSDLEDAISRHRDAVDLTPLGHPHKLVCLTNLGNAFFARFHRFGELSDLEDTILMHRDAVDLSPDGHTDKPSYLNNLGSAFLTRFERLRQLSDLEDAISTLRDAVELAPRGHSDKPNHLNTLGSAFLARFKCLGEPSDLEDAITSYRDAVHLTPLGHPDKPGCLTNLGNAFEARFHCLGELTDLADAISMHRDAVDLTPHSHHDKPGHLTNLGNTLLSRFGRLGELADLEDAISRLRDAVDLIPQGHTEEPNCLANLGNAFFSRFRRLGELTDLKDTISMHSGAVDLTPHSDSDKPNRLNNLGNAFLIRYGSLGELSDLEDAVTRYRDAVDLIPHGHPGKPRNLTNLGNALLTRFERLGELSDLEDAVSKQRDAVDLTAHGHPEKPGRLNNLGNTFVARFECLGELDDLRDAISRLRDAVELTPYGHPDKPIYLDNLGNAFRVRFEHFRELSDLEDAISRHRDAVDLIPHGHPRRSRSLHGLGISFYARFERLRELSDLEDAVLTLRDAVDLTPHGHPDKSARLHNLSNALLTRFEHLGELSDLVDAMSRQKDAIDFTPDGHPYKPTLLSNLGKSFIARFVRFGDPSNLEQAISLYSHAASASTGSITVRFHASQNWISCAQHMRHHTLLRAHSVAIALLPQLAWIGFSLSRRYSELEQAADVVREAAAAAIDSGFLETAVEWLEQGRSVVWGELFQLRSSYEELSVAHPDHARRLRGLSVALEHASATREISSVFSEQTSSAVHRVTESLQNEAERHRRLAIERDKLLQEIRRFPGFEQFLLRKQFSQLRASAHSGPVVILNAAESHCDALVVLAYLDHVIHVPLPTFTFQRSTGLQNMLETLLGHARVIHSDDREGKSATLRGVSWESLLSTLWNGVVKPVLDILAFSTPGDLSRIFWCPTGPFVFLPMHAAGLYGTQQSEAGHKVSDFVVSSYVPTLAILALSSNPAAAPSGDLHLLAVGQPPSDGQSRLPGVDIELEHIRAVIRNSPSARTSLVESSAGTVEEVLSLMKEADWVHFACHGIQDSASATESGLCLADERRLKISDIIALSRPRGGLAFLSACQTAMGDERLTDEAIHIAAGMLFAGYGGVVGTMWSISDKLAPEVARDVYQQLFRNGTRPDYREAARALHEAIGRLRDSGTGSFVTWLPFIHVGL